MGLEEEFSFVIQFKHRKDTELCYRQGNMKDNIVTKKTNKVYVYHEIKVIKIMFCCMGQIINIFFSENVVRTIFLKSYKHFLFFNFKEYAFSA